MVLELLNNRLRPPHIPDTVESGKVAAAGLGVYEREPDINEKLLRQDRALMVAHLGTHTAETLDKMEASLNGLLRRLYSLVLHQ